MIFRENFHHRGHVFSVLDSRRWFFIFFFSFFNHISAVLWTSAQYIVLNFGAKIAKFLGYISNLWETQMMVNRISKIKWHRSPYLRVICIKLTYSWNIERYLRISNIFRIRCKIVQLKLFPHHKNTYYQHRW